MRWWACRPGCGSQADAQAHGRDPPEQLHGCPHPTRVREEDQAGGRQPGDDAGRRALKFLFLQWHHRCP